MSVQSAIGISPKLIILENDLGLRLKMAISQLFSIDATTGAGHSYLYINSQSRHWFHISQELNAGFSFLLGKGQRWTHYGSILPGFYVSVAPLVYVLYGPSIHIRYFIENEGKTSFEIMNLFLRVLWRNTVFSYRWHFQAGLRFSILF